MSTEYSVKIDYASKELTARERISLKDTSLCEPIDELTKEGDLLISLSYYVELTIHNEKARDNHDYRKIIFVDTNGTRYISGSATLARSFMDIYEEMCEEGETQFDFSIVRRSSKNYQGKDFLKAVIK